MKKKRPIELYIHIPFCVKKCAYCDFLSFPAGGEIRRQYVDALLEEAKARAEKLSVRSDDRKSADPEGEPEVCSVFIGGGTPSVLPAEWIAEITDTLRKIFSFRENAEISLEANPGTVTEHKLSLYRAAGVNRLSIGCQSTEEKELRLLGRIHSFEEFLESFAMARSVGFDNINVDLMSGLPEQTKASWERNLRKTAELNPEHLSCYSLILEEGTPLWQNQEAYCFPDEDEERFMYECTGKILQEYGYHQYEISNYCKEGRECLHNLGYWTGTEYLGLGLGASSYINFRRYSNTESLSSYLEESGHPENLERGEEILTPEDRMSEKMILGLRLRSGVSATAFRKEFGRSITEVYGPVIEKYISWNLLEWVGDCLRLTIAGISVSNTVMADFLL